MTDFVMPASTWKLTPVGGSAIDIFVNVQSVGQQANIIDQVVPGSIISNLYFFSAESRTVSLRGKLQGAANLETLKTKAENFTSLTLISDLGNEGTWKIIAMSAPRLQAVNFQNSNWYEVSLQLRKSAT